VRDERWPNTAPRCKRPFELVKGCLAFWQRGSRDQPLAPAQLPYGERRSAGFLDNRTRNRREQHGRHLPRYE
jgi:hypothetical protein